MSSDSCIIALSTCWFGQKVDDGYVLMQRAADMGFEWVELGHGTRVSLVPGIIQAVEKGVVKVSSLHNFCPLPAGVTGAAPNLYQPSSPNQREHEAWVRHTMGTLNFAKRLAVPRVVLHTGRIFRFLMDPSRGLRRYAAQRSVEELGEDPGWIRRREKYLRGLARCKQVHYQRIRDCLSRVAELATEAGVMLGVENREGLLELPLDSDFVELLEPLEMPEIFGFWHDTGHARRKEQLGFLDHRELLNQTHERLCGFHLHQVTPEGRDHHSLTHPEGTIDFNMVKEFFKPAAPLVLEFSPRVSEAEVIGSRHWLHQQLLTDQ